MADTLAVFERFQKSRADFVRGVADLAIQPAEMHKMENARIVPLIGSLLRDQVQSISQCACIALGRIAVSSDVIAQAIIDQPGLLAQAAQSLQSENAFTKRSAAFVMRAVAMHSSEHAKAVVGIGALESIGSLLEDFDPSVKESAAWSVAYVACHSADLAQTVMDNSLLPGLLLCAQEPEAGVQRAAICAISDIVKHSADFASTACEGEFAQYLVNLLKTGGTRVKRAVCQLIAQVAKHTKEIAETLGNAGIVQPCVHALASNDSILRRNAATALREIARHSVGFSREIANGNNAADLVGHICNASGDEALPTIAAVGFAGGHSGEHASPFLETRLIAVLRKILQSPVSAMVKAAAAWSVGQLGKHSAEHARRFTEQDMIKLLCTLYMDESGATSEKTREKAKFAVKEVLSQCTDPTILESLLDGAPLKIQKYLLRQLASVLPTNKQAQRTFAYGHGLQFVQDLRVNADPKLQKAIDDVLAVYPNDLVSKQSADYGSQLLKQLDSFQPSVQPPPENDGDEDSD